MLPLMAETLPRLVGVPSANDSQAGKRTPVLLVSADRETAALFRRSLKARYELVHVKGLDDGRDALSAGEIGVVCLAGKLSAEEVCVFLEDTQDVPVRSPRVNLVFNAGLDPSSFHELLVAGRIFYFAHHTLPENELAALVDGAARQYRKLCRPGQSSNDCYQRDSEDLFRRLAAQEDPAATAELVVDSACERTGAVRAYCLFYDPVTDSLWTRDPATTERHVTSASVGLVGFVLRSGLTIHLTHLRGDPRYDREADDPAGNGDEQLLAVPLIATSGNAIGVVAVVREDDAADFLASDLHRLKQLAVQVAPFIATMGRADLYAQAGYERGPFRPSMVNRLFRRSEVHTDPLRISSVWMGVSYWVLVAALIGFVSYSLIGEIDEYASGVAVVTIVGRTDLTAVTAGTVTAVEVEPGQRVQPGQSLVRFNNAKELAELARIEKEFSLQLINRLWAPTDPVTEQALISQRAQLELGRARLGERTLRSSIEGVVEEVRVRSGQYFQPGQIVLSVIGDEREPLVAAMIPGRYRPLLHPGIPMRFEISGYRYAYQHLKVDSVSNEVLGPAEVLRHLGPGISDAVQLTGPVVIVKARLPAEVFEVDGKTYKYHNGMHGIADIRIRSEKILLALIPALKRMTRSNDG